MNIGLLDPDDPFDYLLVYEDLIDHTIKTWSLPEPSFRMNYKEMIKKTRLYRFITAYKQLSDEEISSICNIDTNNSENSSTTCRQEKSLEESYLKQQAVIANITIEMNDLKDEVARYKTEIEKLENENSILRKAAGLKSEDLSLFIDGVESIDKLINAVKMYGKITESDKK